MDVDRLSTGEKIAGVSAILLFIFMFLDWFSVSVENGLYSVTAGNAWDWLDVIPIVLMIAVIVAIGVAVIRLTDAVFEPSVPMNAVVALLGALSFLLILYRIVSPPDSGFPGVDISPAVGIFLSLLAAAGIAYGGYRAMQEEGASFSDIGDSLGSGGRGPTPPPPPPPAS